MSVRLYDEAITNKIKGWIKDEKLRVLSPDDTSRLFSMRSDMTNDKPLDLPLISIVRGNEIELDYPHKKMMSYDGMMLDANYEKSLQIDAIPMTLTYQIDIYTKYSYEADEYMRNLVFNLINLPTIKVILPYNSINDEHWANIKILSTIEDNSDIPQKLFGSLLSRWTIRFVVDDAYLFSLPYKDNVHIVGCETELVES